MHNDKKLTTYLLILLSFGILIFFTKTAYSELQIQLSEEKINEEKVQELETRKDNLSEIQKKMNDEESDIRKEISAYVNEFTEHDILAYFHGYAASTGGKFGIMSLTLDKKDVNEYGFREGIINLTVSVESEDVVLTFLDFILDKDAKYRFFIDKFDLPEKVEGRKLGVKIPLKIFYK